MARLSLSFLGGYQVRLDGENLDIFESDKVRGLLAFLAVESNQFHRREHLVGLLWPEHSERHARRNLNQALYNLREVLHDREKDQPILISTHQTIGFNQNVDYLLDVASFNALLNEFHNHNHQDLVACDGCVERLVEVVDLYHGSFLEGFSLRSLAYEEWLVIWREKLHRQACQAFYHLINILEKRGEVGRALELAWRQVEIDPLRERAYRQLMRLLDLSGQHSQALAQYESLRHNLDRELGVEPDQKTIALYERIRAKIDPSAIDTWRRSNLPSSLTSFVGRMQELSDLRVCIADPDCRLLTVVGPGGSGKTRLALEEAVSLIQDFSHGVYWVALNPVQSPESIPPVIADVIGFPIQEKSDPLEQLRAYLRAKNMLIVLDGFEHLLDGASLVADILKEAPDMKILVTSRVRLNIMGEKLYTLYGMQYPESPDLLSSTGQYDAVKLFVSGAQRVKGDYDPDRDDLESIIQICRQVQGMPLGILLASTWVRSMDIGNIAKEVKRSLDFLSSEWSDVPERQRSIRATFDYSWQLLSQREQRIFENQSVFRGGFTREAARQISKTSTYDLRALVDKSFLQPSGTGRYEVHELMRQYGAEKLANRPDADLAAKERHSTYFCKALEGWDKELKSSHQEIALKEMDIEHENFRLAWNWAVEHGQVEQLDLALEGLCLYYEFRVRFQEGVGACQMAVEMMTNKLIKNDVTLTLVRLRTWSARFNRLLGNVDTAQRLRQESLDLIGEVEDDELKVLRARAFLYLEMGNVMLHTDREAANRWFKDSLRLYRSLGDDWGAAKALTGFGEVAYRLGNYDEAINYYKNSLDKLRVLGDPRGCANCLAELSSAVFRLGRLEEGDVYLRECMDLYVRVGDRVGMARGFKEMGRRYAWYGRFDKAEQAMGKAEAIYMELGYLHDLAFVRTTVGFATVLAGRYEQTISQSEKVIPLTEKMNFHRLTGVAYFVSGCAKLAQCKFIQAKEDLEKAADIFSLIEQHDDLACAVSAQGIIAIKSGWINQAKRDLHKAWKIYYETRGFIPSSFILILIALYLIERREVEKAVEVYTAIKHYPMVAKSPWFEDIAGREIMEKAFELPSENVTAAQKRGMSRDLYEIAEEFLDALLRSG